MYTDGQQMDLQTILMNNDKDTIQYIYILEVGQVMISSFSWRGSSMKARLFYKLYDEVKQDALALSVATWFVSADEY